MRTAVITGATQGLGWHAARAVAADPGWRVVLAVRDRARGDQVAAGLRSGGADVVALDLAALASVDAAADTLLDGPPLDALVLNAGLQVTRADRATADGVELTFGVNHLGHFALVERLGDHLADGARVVVVSSGTHFGTLRQSMGYPAPQWPDDPRLLARPREASGQVAYASSKLANVLHAYELARRLAPRGIRVNAYDPGLMPETALARDYGPRAQRLYARLAPVLAAVVPGATRPDLSARHLADLAMGREHPEATGRYVQRGRAIRSAPITYDVARQDALRDASRDLVGAVRRAG